MVYKNHEELGTKIGAFVDVKNVAYQNSFSKVSRMLAIAVEDLSGEEVKTILGPVVNFARRLDKEIRHLRNSAKGGDLMAEDPRWDNIGYLLLDLFEDSNKVEEKKPRSKGPKHKPLNAIRKPC